MVRKSKKKLEEEKDQESENEEAIVKSDDIPEESTQNSTSESADQYSDLREKLLNEYEAQKSSADQLDESHNTTEEPKAEDNVNEEKEQDSESVDSIVHSDDIPEETSQDSASSGASQYDDLRKKLLKEYEAQKPSLVKEEGHEDKDHEDENQLVEEDHEDEDQLVEEDHEDEDQLVEEDHEDEDQLAEEDHEDEDYADKGYIGEDNSEQGSDDLQEDLNASYDNTAPDVDQDQSGVAVSSKKSLAMMVILALVVVFILYSILKPEVSVDRKSQVDKNAPITVPVADTGQAIIVPEIPQIPTAPRLSAPTPPPAPTPPMVSDLNVVKPIAAPIVASTASVFKKEDPAEKARKKARLSSGIMVGGASTSSKNKNVTRDGKSLSILARNNDQIVATSIGDLRRVIAQGKVVDAVLETAINTDLPGTARAIISRDIYSEGGKNILIPRGSRLLGVYSSNVTFGINRIKMNWSRLIRPDGVDISISSPGIDQIGHAGMAGDLDNHVAKSISVAVMTSVIDIAAGVYADKQAELTTVNSTVQPATGTAHTTNADGTLSNTQASTTGSNVVTGTINNEQQAYLDATENIGSVGKGILEKTNDMKPTITIDQGTALKVFVNKDLVFPGKSANLTRIVE
jgi:type IV secretion system protein VirB10